MIPSLATPDIHAAYCFDEFHTTDDTQRTDVAMRLRLDRTWRMNQPARSAG